MNSFTVVSPEEDSGDKISAQSVSKFNRRKLQNHKSLLVMDNYQISLLYIHSCKMSSAMCRTSLSYDIMV